MRDGVKGGKEWRGKGREGVRGRKNNRYEAEGIDAAAWMERWYSEC